MSTIDKISLKNTQGTRVEYDIKDSTARRIATTTQTALDDKVDKVTGKGLSTNDFTNSHKDKLDGLSLGTNADVTSIINGTWEV